MSITWHFNYIFMLKDWSPTMNGCKCDLFDVKAIQTSLLNSLANQILVCRVWSDWCVYGLIDHTKIFKTHTNGLPFLRIDQRFTHLPLIIIIIFIRFHRHIEIFYIELFTQLKTIIYNIHMSSKIKMFTSRHKLKS